MRIKSSADTISELNSLKTKEPSEQNRIINDAIKEIEDLRRIAEFDSDRVLDTLFQRINEKKTSLAEARESFERNDMQPSVLETNGRHYQCAEIMRMIMDMRSEVR